MVMLYLGGEGRGGEGRGCFVASYFNNNANGSFMISSLSFFMLLLPFASCAVMGTTKVHALMHGGHMSDSILASIITPSSWT